MRITKLPIVAIILASTIILVLGLEGYSDSALVSRFVQISALIGWALVYAAAAGRSIHKHFRLQRLESLTQLLTYNGFVLILAHGVFAFLQLGGIESLSFLNTSYIVALGIGVLSLVGVAVRLVLKVKYVESILPSVILLTSLHALIIGPHFRERNVFVVLVVGLTLLLCALEAARLEKMLTHKYKVNTHNLITLALMIPLSLGVGTYLLQARSPLSTHNTHQQQSIRADFHVETSLDKSLSTTFSFRFRVINDKTGEHQTQFTKVHNQLMRLLVLSPDGQDLQILFPLYEEGDFIQDIKLDQSGTYKFVFNYYPADRVEQKQTVLIPVNNSVPAAQDDKSAGHRLEVTPKDWSSGKLADGTQEFDLRLLDATNSPVTTLPYLGSLSDLTLVNKNSQEVIFTHPTKLSGTKEDTPVTNLSHNHVGESDLRPFDLGGPTISFAVYDLGEELKPGAYTAFATFYPSGKMIQLNFDLVIK